MPKAKLPDKDFEWTPELAYAIGLLATDGNLSKDGRHLAIRSSDFQLLKIFKKCLNLNNKIIQTKNDQWAKRPCYILQFGNIQLYRWLLKIGLFPNKTYTIGKLKIPDKFFPDFLRGHFDGDGNIRFYKDKYNKYKNRTYINNRLYLRFFSVSLNHLKWLQLKIKKNFKLKGVLFSSKNKNRTTPIWILKFSKKESINLLKRIYYKSDLPALNRKRKIATLALNTIRKEKRKKYSWVR